MGQKGITLLPDAEEIKTYRYDIFKSVRFCTFA